MDIQLANSMLRWVLDLAALMAMINWGLRKHEGYSAAAWAIGLPMFVGTIMATFFVPGDTGNVLFLVPVPGFVRLLLEAGYFGLAVWLLRDTKQGHLGFILAAFVVLHYALAYQRILWLLAQW